MSVNIIGFGTANPPSSMSQREATELAIEVCNPDQRQTRLLQALYRKSGVENRYTVLPHRTAADWVDPELVGDNSMGPSTAARIEYFNEHIKPLARAASSNALVDAAVDASQITHLVTVSCTGFRAPGFDIDLIQTLNLPATTERAHIGFMGCHGAINGLRVAQGLANLSPRHRVLLCAAECCSLHYRFQWDPDRFVGNALFADGSAALVLSSDQTPASERNVQLIATGSTLIPNSLDALTWDVGDNGFEMYLSPRIPNLIETNLKPWLETWLAEHDLQLADVRGWAVHPGGPRILQAVQNSLALADTDLSTSREILASYGNMSSPTVLFILERMRRSPANLPCVALGFGPGVMAEAALFV